MPRGTVLATIAFLAGLGVGFFARTAALSSPRQNAGHAADMAAIGKLHRADEACTLTQDPKCLIALWSPDAINLVFPGPPAVGIKAIGEAFAKFRAEYPDFRVLKYNTHITQVRILDGWAIEVGYTQAAYQMSANAKPVIFPKTEGMRLLKRQSDGSWKFALVGMKWTKPCGPSSREVRY
jgi:hypothetical protein